ncbi:hypothetical protein ACIBL6_14115 [Streptomyces sp. NPDC050400]|uniref:hypothetical protein n=1 Tax=Streptomyces sp. NPDC050400 TaxID=3365610 RepID=UPI003795B992
MRISARVATAVLSLAVAIVPCTAQATARPTAPPSPSSVTADTRPADVVRGGSPESAVDRVADFYGAYIDAVHDGTDRLPDQLRAHYLTRDLQRRLAGWEQANHADGVLRAQDVPRHWEVRNQGAGAGHVFSIVTLTWGSPQHPTYTRIAVRSDLRTKLISDIKQG